MGKRERGKGSRGALRGYPVGLGERLTNRIPVWMPPPFLRLPRVQLLLHLQPQPEPSTPRLPPFPIPHPKSWHPIANSLWRQGPSCPSGMGQGRRARTAKFGTAVPCRVATLGKGREASGARPQPETARERTRKYVTEPDPARTKRSAAYRPAPLLTALACGRRNRPTWALSLAA